VLTPLAHVLSELAPEAIVEVFAAYGVSLAKKTAPLAPIPLKTPAGKPIVAGVVRFAGEAIRGTLLLATSFDVAASVWPARLERRPVSEGSSSDWVLVRDWIGELANQGIGRIKNRLHRRGVSFDVYPPSALSGPALAFATPKGPAPLSHVFSAGGGDVWSCFDAAYDVNRRVPDSQESDVREGKIVIFE
jgi:CheY-specific phosphatase CheX